MLVTMQKKISWYISTIFNRIPLSEFHKWEGEGIVLRGLLHP